MRFRKLPSLTGLRAFEATARLGSIKSAADELCVTPAAVGAQLQSLEKHLGVTLFERSHRSVKPTDAAMNLQKTCQLAFSTLLEAVEHVEHTAADKSLTIGVGTLFASHWLSPRISQFLLQHPDTALRLTHAPTSMNFEDSGIDGMIIWGSGDWPAFNVDEVLRPHIVPVASPRYIEKYGTPESPQDLLKHALIFEQDDYMWLEWLRNQGVVGVLQSSGTTARDGVLAIQLARDDQGIALGVSEFLQNELSAGTLTALFPPQRSKFAAYYFFSKHDVDETETRLSAFREWILEKGKSPSK